MNSKEVRAASCTNWTSQFKTQPLRPYRVMGLAFQILCHFRMTEGRDFVIIQSYCSPPLN